MATAARARRSNATADAIATTWRSVVEARFAVHPSAASALVGGAVVDVDDHGLARLIAAVEIREVESTEHRLRLWTPLATPDGRVEPYVVAERSDRRDASEPARFVIGRNAEWFSTDVFDRTNRRLLAVTRFENSNGRPIHFARLWVPECLDLPAGQYRLTEVWTDVRPGDSTSGADESVS